MTRRAWTVEAENVAGIRSGSASVEPGVNAVRGANWQGKSSFVTAVETAMGTEAILTEGERAGRVELSTPSETVSVELVREDGQVERRGDPYLSTERTRAAASLFAFLDDSNAVREAVRTGADLEALLTRPLAFENIDERIADRSAERDRVEAELDRARSAAEQLTDVRARIRRLEDDLAELRDERDALSDGRDAPAAGHHEELSDAKAERDAVEGRIDRLERTVERTRERLAERRADLKDLDVPETDADLVAEIEARQETLERTRSDAELLQSVYAPTRRIIDENRLDLITDVDRDVLADSLACWTCGAETTRQDVEENLDALGDRITELRDRADEYEREVSDLTDRREEAQRAARRESDLEAEIADLESTLEDRETTLERARRRREELDDRIDELSETVRAENAELTDLESQIKYTEAQLDEAREKRETLEGRAQRHEELEAERDELTAEIRRLRDRKATLKRRAREAFDEAIREVLSRFDVSFEMGRLTPQFDLVVARGGREVDPAALSEGELELLGIVTALAGYEAFDVAADVPLMLLDGLGGLADDNLGTLIDYLADRAEFLVFTTYPETTRVEENTIDPAEWTVVSRETGPTADD